MTRPKGGLLELLLAHGVPEPAARIYLVASREGPLTASELARATAIHRVHGYRFIRDLVDQGLLRAAGQRPARFAALPVPELLDRWIAGTAEELDRLKNDRERLVDEVLHGPHGLAGADGRRFTVVEGRPAIHAFLRRRIGAARKEILISVAGFALARAIDGGIDRALKEAQARHLKVRVVTEASPSNLAEVKLFDHVAEMRHAIRPMTSRAVLIDREQAYLFVSGEEGLGGNGDAELLLATSDPHFLALTREHHQRLWAHAVPINERLVELESPPRAVLPVPREQMGETFQRLREITELGMTATGMEQISIDLPDLIQAVAAQLGHQIGEEIEGRSPEEVARSLAEFYSKKSGGKMQLVKESPLTVKITECFACRNTPEIGRVLCPALIGAVLERRLGGSWDVSKPDPSRHATRGCLFALTEG